MVRVLFEPCVFTLIKLFLFGSGITYNSIMSPPTNWHTKLLLATIDTKTCMNYKYCRGYARAADVL
jgi:hypothetical protein